MSDDICGEILNIKLCVGHSKENLDKMQADKATYLLMQDII